MKARREFRNRDDVQVAVLDALVDRHADGMTVFELRSHVDADIDDLEDALAALKSDGLITAEDADGRTRLSAADHVVPRDGEPDDASVLDTIRRKLGL